MNKKGLLGNFIALVAVLVTVVLFAFCLPFINTVINNTLPFLADAPIATFLLKLFPFILLFFIVYRGLQLIRGGVQ